MSESPMSDLVSDPDAPERALGRNPIGGARLPPPLHYALAVVLVALATVLAFAAQQVVSAANLTLIYVLPVVIAASASGWGPSLVAVVLGATTFDFFFTEPYYSLAIANPSEIWAVGLLLAIATIVASVSATSRRRALEAIEAADNAEALRTVAHAIIHDGTRPEVLRAAAAALHRMFRAPAVVLVQDGPRLDVAATDGGAELTETDRAAALDALSSGSRTRGEAYPHDRASFDFWPLASAAGGRYVLGVDFAHAARERPAAPERLVEAVAGYVASALVRDRPAPSRTREGA